MTGGEEMVVPAVLFISASAVVLYFLRRHFDLKRESMLAEAALRKLEMEKGYPPGTYSRKKGKSGIRADRWERARAEKQAQTEKTERRDLEKGIEELKMRMENIDTIVSRRKGE